MRRLHPRGQVTLYDPICGMPQACNTPEAQFRVWGFRWILPCTGFVSTFPIMQHPPAAVYARFLQARRVSNELREFDKVLAERDHEKRVEQWRKGGRS